MLLIYVSVMKPGEPGFENTPQHVPCLPAVNDTFILEGKSWRVCKVAHGCERPPLVYLSAFSRELTSTEQEHFQ